MATKKLNRPTGTEVVNAFGVVSGVENTAGGYTATDIDNDYTNNGTASLLDIKYQEMLTAISGSYNFEALDATTEYPYIFRALTQITFWAYFEQSVINKTCKDCAKGTECYEAKKEQAYKLICDNLTAVGISLGDYCFSELDFFTTNLSTNGCTD